MGQGGRSCDVAVVGAGTAGLAAFEVAREEGADVVLIEKGPGGTTCARTGCMPSKLLIAAAEARHAIGRLPLFGLSITGDVRVDGPAVMSRVQRERDRFVGAVLEGVDEIPAAMKLSGSARFTGPNCLAVDGVPLEARSIVIATGSVATLPEPLRPFGDDVLTDRNVFDLPEPPRSLAVIGAGPLGLEIAQAFSRLGTRVVVLDKGEVVLGIADPEAERVARSMIGRELELHLGVEIEAERQGDGFRLRWSGGREGEGSFEQLLVAAGRRPVLDELDLPAAGLALDDEGVPVFDRETMRCGNSAVFIAGDASAERPILHEASIEGRIAGLNAARFPDVATRERQPRFTVAYTDPEVASVGVEFTGEEAERLAVGCADLRESGRARVMGRNGGLIRLYGDRQTGSLKGGIMVGPEAEHLGHMLAWLVQLDVTVDDALRLPFYHPTLEEAFLTALRDLRRALREGG